MKKQSNMPWDAARVASRRELPKQRLLHGPVGSRLESNGAPGITASKRSWCGPFSAELPCCRGCGYHVCSCPIDPPYCPQCGPMPPATLTHRCPEGLPFKVVADARVPKDCAFFIGVDAALTPSRTAYTFLRLVNGAWQVVS